MKKREKHTSILLIIGILLVMGAPYLPDFFFYVIWETKFSDFRLSEIIPSIRLGGVLLFIWGMMRSLKKENKTETHKKDT